MKPKNLLCLLAAALAAPVCSAAPIFSWETDTEGWVAGGALDSVATSTTGVTEGSQALAVTMPMSGQDVNAWWRVGATITLTAEQLQAIFTDATELKLDAYYPDPGYNSWYGAPQIEIIIQGDNVAWTGLATRDVTIDATSQTLTYPLTIAQAAGMATSNSGQILLRFSYGNGGVTSPNAVFYVDNFTNTVVADPPPATNLYWKGDVDDQWTSLNWTTDLAGTVAGGPLPTDGSAGIAFASDGSINLNSVLGADQSVSSIVVTPGVSPAIGGTHSLTVGAGGIWLEDAAAGLTIDTTGGVVLGANQVWKNKSTAPLAVNSVISGSGTLTKSGAGPTRLGGANIYTGGTVVEQGALVLDHADALGGATASVAINGGWPDLNGLDVTLGALSGLGGGIIHNTSATPSTLTLDFASDSSYGCQISDAVGGAPVSLVKKGIATATSNGGGTFTGPVTIEDGLFVANTWVFNVPNWSSFGNAQVAGRTITVTSPGALSFTNNAIFGNAMADTSLLPEIILNETTLNSTRYNQIGPITLNGAILSQASTDTGNYQGYQFKGDITVTGTNASSIQGSGMANHLSSETVFNVADVSGSPDFDLIVSSPLTNQSGDFANAAGGLTKSGPGSMALDGFNTYSGVTRVLEGMLSLGTATLSDSAGVEIATGAVLDLAHFDTDSIAALTIGGVTMVDGIYGAVGSGAQFERAEITGGGMLAVFDDPFIPWIASFTTLTGPTAEKDADPDFDGLTNFEEFALDGNPEEGTATGKVRSRVETVGADQALVITLPVRNGAAFSGTAPAVATVAADGIDYEIGGSNDLMTFDQEVSEVVPALAADMPGLNTGWTYRTFRLNGAVGGGTPRGPKGFLRATVHEAL
jgi:autotransporter-associated beta strand protein